MDSFSKWWESPTGPFGYVVMVIVLIFVGFFCVTGLLMSC